MRSCVRGAGSGGADPGALPPGRDLDHGHDGKHDGDEQRKLAHVHGWLRFRCRLRIELTRIELNQVLVCFRPAVHQLDRPHKRRDGRHDGFRRGEAYFGAPGRRS